jgi:hypothetical protein
MRDPKSSRPGSTSDVRDIIHKQVPVGKLSDTLNLLSRDELYWIKKSVPHGSTVAEFLAGVIRDAVAEE